jgi:hypothetical protein
MGLRSSSWGESERRRTHHISGAAPLHSRHGHFPPEDHGRQKCTGEILLVATTPFPAPNERKFGKRLPEIDETAD